MSLVGLAKAMKKNETREVIERSLDLINYKFPAGIKKIVIKPNMCYYWDFTTGQTTDPKFVASLVELIRDQVSRNVEISIVEADASAMKCKYAFRMLGYEKLVQNYDNLRLVNLSRDKGTEVKVAVKDQHLNFTLPKTISDADLLINVPKIKYMSLTKISCALKNIYGCNPYPKKFKYHENLDKVIVGLNKIMRFDIAILDGIIVSGTKPHKLDLVMSSQDPVAFDVVASKIAGVNPKSVKHIMLAHKEGLGRLTFNSKGVDPKFFMKSFPKPSFTSKVLVSAYKLAIKTRLLDSDMM
jgi:uncharacterized protein (DUF362 family)